MVKCELCGRPAIAGEMLCGFCKVSKTKPEKKESTKNVVVNTDIKVDTSNFNKYDSVSSKRLTKKTNTKIETLGGKSYDVPVFSQYDVVSTTAKTKSITVDTTKEDETTSTEDSCSYNSNFSSAIPGVAIATLVFLITLTVYGQVSSSLNTAVISAPVSSLMSLIPLILVGVAIVGMITMVFKLSS